jgi:D-serine deaminase-like pyridoxal phosphate-dependent protein
MDISLETHQSYIGQPISALPTPALVISKPVLENNVKKLHDDVETLGIGFRPHVKTLKVYSCLSQIQLLL